MPNQRDPRKKQFSSWLWADDIETLRKGAEENGMSVVDFIHALCREHERALGRNNEKQRRKNDQ